VDGKFLGSEQFAVRRGKRHVEELSPILEEARRRETVSLSEEDKTREKGNVVCFAIDCEARWL